MDLIEQLGIPHRRMAAYRELLALGPAALPSVRAGLKHANRAVRSLCVFFLDHYLTPEVLLDLIAMLDDPHPRVRLVALHALACDRCKEGDCRPEEGAVLPRALAILANDPDPHVRAMAIELIGRFVHTSVEAECALLSAKADDPSPAVRKKAGWYAPGGTIHRRTAPRTPRRRPHSSSVQQTIESPR